MRQAEIAHTRFPSTLGIISTLLLVLFGLKVMLMYLLPQVLPVGNPLLENLIDAGSLTILFTPLLHHFIFKPFRKIAAVQSSLAETIMAQLVDGVVVLDSTLAIRSLNGAAERMFGYPGAEAAGKGIDQILGGALAGLAGPGQLPPAPGPGGPVREVSALRRDGSTLSVELSLSPLQLGTESLWLVIVRDLTEQRNLEHQLRHAQKMEALGALAGGVAHDFNNILTVIMGFCTISASMLEQQSPLRHNLDQIMAASERALTLTGSLLAYSRKQPMNFKPLELNGRIRQTEKFLARLIGEEIELVSRLSTENLTVMADGGQLEQVLMNLAANARDAMSRQGCLAIESRRIEIDEEFVRLHGYGKPGSFALVSVSDTGTGMDQSTREKIFEPFFTTKETGQGTGLGLSIVYGIVKQHQGYINVYSEPGKGTSIHIYLPVIEATETRESFLLRQVRGGSETLLLAEDDPGVRVLVKSVLEGSGYRVIEACDGEDAAAKFRDYQAEVELLLLDVVMPRKNGREAWQEISAIRPGIKALFISGYAADIVSRNGLIDSGVQLVMKPLLPNQLLARIREVLDQG
ncbi:MAG TPA: ATP-binding protein [Geomonas sp.]|nr:ATP-binding protein [Geomonas sp.]